MTLSIVIVSWKVMTLLRKCLESIQAYPPSCTYEVWVVDNNSQDGTVEMVKAHFPWVRLIASKDNNGFAKGNNIAIAQAIGQYVLLLNPDTELHPHALDICITYLESHPSVGALGPKLLNPDGTLQPSCKSFPTVSLMIYNSLFLDVLFPKSPTFGRYEMSGWAYDTLREVDQPMGAALFVRQSVIDEIGLMDEQFYMFFDEVDWCYRIKSAGHQIVFLPGAEITHHGGQSIKSAEWRMSYYWHQSLKRFFFKHYGIPEKITSALIIMMFVAKLSVVSLLVFVIGWIVYSMMIYSS